jgi:hypothetical protein
MTRRGPEFRLDLTMTGLGRLARVAATSLAFVALTGLPASTRTRTDTPPAANRPTPAATVNERYGRLPMSFEANHGQFDGAVAFVAHTRDSSVFLTPSEAVLALPAGDATTGTGGALRMQLVGGSPGVVPAGQAELPGRTNYIIGADPAKWYTDIPTYAQIEYAAVYPGVDQRFHGDQGQLEYDFVVGAGSDPAQIQLAFDGADGLAQDAAGDLVISTRGGPIVQRKPSLYQELDGVRLSIDGGYVLAADAAHVGFWVGSYDPARALVIDPVLVYSTFLGGDDTDQAIGIAVDRAGSAYVTGTTASANFPASPGAFQPTRTGTVNAFVTKLNPTGTGLVYSTFLGGTVGHGGGASGDAAQFIAVDAAGDAYVTGATISLDFPTTAGAFKRTNSGADVDTFVTNLNPTGTGLVYSTLLSGTQLTTFSIGLAVDGDGSAYVTGVTNAADFPTTPGAFGTTPDGQFQVFVTKLNPTGSAPLVYSTFLGEGFGNSVVVDTAGNAYVAGFTSSPTFPTTPGAFQTTLGGQANAFVSKLNPQGTAPLAYSTYLGGTGQETADAIAIDSAGNAYLTGSTTSPDFPTTPGVVQTTLIGPQDAFVTKLNATGSGPLVYSTYLGGDAFETGIGLALDTAGSAYITGATNSSDFPITATSQTRRSTAARSSPSKTPFLQSVPFVARLNRAASLRTPVRSSSPASVTASVQNPSRSFVTKLNTTATPPLLYSTELGVASVGENVGITVVCVRRRW